MSFIATRHGNEINNPTMTLLAKEFESNAYDIVLLEGLPFEKGINPAFYLEGAKKSIKDNFIEWGETGYAAVLAGNRSIPIAGGEPNDKEILLKINEGPFSSKDLIGFYVVRQFPQWLRQHRFERETRDKVVSDFLSTVCGDFGLSKSECLDLSEFKQWYKEKNGKEFGFNFESEEAAPLANGKYITQHISSLVGQVRDRFVLQKIEELLSEYNRILVVYGSSHYMTLFPAITNALGAPEYSGDLIETSNPGK